MLVAVAAVEVLVRVASKVAQTLNLVLHSVRVNDVHDDSDAILVCFIHQLLQFLWRAETATWSEEVGNVVAETAVVRVLGNGHDLDAVVAILDDAREHIVLEFSVGSHLFRILSHTDVAFVDEQWVSVWLEILFLPNVRCFRSPNLCGENLRVFVLYHSVNPSRDALAFPTLPFHVEFEQIAVLHGTRTEFQFPVARVLQTLHLVLVLLLPVVEIAHHVDVSGIWCPLTQHPSALVGAVETIIKIAIGKVREFLLAIVGELVEFPERMLMSSANSILKRFEPCIILHQSDMLYFLRSHTDY